MGHGVVMVQTCLRAAGIPFLCFVALFALSCQHNEPDKGEHKAIAQRSVGCPERLSERPDLRRSTLQTIRERGELRVGMQVGYVPFQMLGPQGSLVGFDVDAAQVLSRAMGVGLRIVRQNWAELIPSLLEGKTDLVMSGGAITPARNIEVVFSVPLLETGRMFLVHQKN